MFPIRQKRRHRDEETHPKPQRQGLNLSSQLQHLGVWPPPPWLPEHIYQGIRGRFWKSSSASPPFMSTYGCPPESNWKTRYKYFQRQKPPSTLRHVSSSMFCAGEELVVGWIEMTLFLFENHTHTKEPHSSYLVCFLLHFILCCIQVEFWYFKSL